jgi:hypothetical protein
MAKPSDLTGKTGMLGLTGPVPTKIALPNTKPTGPTKGNKGGTNPAFKMSSGGRPAGGAGGASRRPKV